MSQERLPFPMAGSDGSASAMGEASAWYPALCELIEAQIACAQTLLGLVHEQGAALQSRDPQTLLDVIQRREPIVREMLLLNQRIEPLAGDLPQRLTQLDPARREQLLERAALVDELIAQVNERDRHDQIEMEKQRDELARELAQTRVGQGAVSAYVPSPVQPGPRFQDQRG